MGDAYEIPDHPEETGHEGRESDTFNFGARSELSLAAAVQEIGYALEEPQQMSKEKRKDAEWILKCALLELQAQEYAPRGKQCR